jgi:hypothetical protein
VGALEAKKLYMFSGWSLERCELFAIEDRKSNSQLENSLFSREDFVDAFSVEHMSALAHVVVEFTPCRDPRHGSV